MTKEIMNKEELMTEVKICAKRIIETLRFKHLNNSGEISVSVPYFSDLYGQRVFTLANKYLLTKGLIEVTVRKNFAEIKLSANEVTKLGDVESMLRLNKCGRYLLPQAGEKSKAVMTQLRDKGGVTFKHTGINRPGFEKMSKVSYTFDKEMLSKYFKEVVEFTTEKLQEEKFTTDYTSIVKDLIKFYTTTEREFTLGQLTLDSRGRAIYEATRRVFNPISNKCARALVVTEPRALTDYNSVFMFISELLYGFNPNPIKKIGKGKKAYEKRIIKGTTYEKIWLERLYSGLDNPESFDVPIEVDMSSSNMTLLGALLGQKAYVDSTKYLWNQTGVSKLQIKTVQTPRVFGSLKSIVELWNSKKISFTTDEVVRMKELETTTFGEANAFTKMLVESSNPKAEMVLDTYYEQFRVVCNRFKNVGEESKAYVCFTTPTKAEVIINHTPIKEDDLESFKRFFPTGLIHNLDSRLFDIICQGLDWAIPIHDALLVHPNEGDKVKVKGAEELQKIHRDRKKIISSYCKSIGCKNPIVKGEDGIPMSKHLFK